MYNTSRRDLRALELETACEPCISGENTGRNRSRCNGVAKGWYISGRGICSYCRNTGKVIRLPVHVLGQMKATKTLFQVRLNSRENFIWKPEPNMPISIINNRLYYTCTRVRAPVYASRGEWSYVFPYGAAAEVADVLEVLLDEKERGLRARRTTHKAKNT